MMRQLIFGLAAALATAAFAQSNNTSTAGMMLGATNEPTTITCAKWTYQYARNIVTFQGDVLAVNPRATIRADNMQVTLNESRSISNIIAEGKVVITTPTNEKGTGNHAVFTNNDRRLVLTGEPKVEARGTVWTGETISFILDEKGIKDIIVEAGQTNTNRSQLIIYPEAQKKKPE